MTIIPDIDLPLKSRTEIICSYMELSEAYTALRTNEKELIRFVNELAELIGKLKEKVELNDEEIHKKATIMLHDQILRFRTLRQN